MVVNYRAKEVKPMLKGSQKAERDTFSILL